MDSVHRRIQDAFLRGFRDEFIRMCNDCIAVKTHLSYPRLKTNSEENLTKYTESIYAYVKKAGKLGRAQDEKGGEQAVKTTAIIEHEKQEPVARGSPTWCPRAPGRPQGPCRSPAGRF